MDKHKKIFEVCNKLNRYLYKQQVINYFSKQHLKKILPINDGPISLNSLVLNPFSPVPTNAITKPIAIVPRPTQRKAFAKELGPLNTPSKSSSSEEPPNEESCIYQINFLLLKSKN